MHHNTTTTPFLPTQHHNHPIPTYTTPQPPHSYLHNTTTTPFLPTQHHNHPIPTYTTPQPPHSYLHNTILFPPKTLFNTPQSTHRLCPDSNAFHADVANGSTCKLLPLLAGPMTNHLDQGKIGWKRGKLGDKRGKLGQKGGNWVRKSENWVRKCLPQNTGIPIGWPPLLSCQCHEVFSKHWWDAILPLHSATSAFVCKGAVKYIQGAVIQRSVVWSSGIVVVVCKTQAHCVAIVIAAHLCWTCLMCAVWL